MNTYNIIDKTTALGGEKVKEAWRMKRGAVAFLDSKILSASKDAEPKMRLSVERIADSFLEFLTKETESHGMDVSIDEARKFSFGKTLKHPSWSPEEVRNLERSPEGDGAYFSLVDSGVEKKLASGIVRACVFAALAHRDMKRAELCERVLTKEARHARVEEKTVFAVVEYESPELGLAI